MRNEERVAQCGDRGSEEKVEGHVRMPLRFLTQLKDGSATYQQGPLSGSMFVGFLNSVLHVLDLQNL